MTENYFFRTFSKKLVYLENKLLLQKVGQTFIAVSLQYNDWKYIFEKQ